MAKEVPNKVCHACGTTLSANAKFCNECGTKYEPIVEPKEEGKTVTQTMLLRKMVYSVKESAASLSISESTLNNLIAKGEIVVCRQGKRVGITEWSLYNYARSHEDGTPDDMRKGLMLL